MARGGGGTAHGATDRDLPGPDPSGTAG